MRRDTQIGIVLGATILVIIGVFLSTRSSVKEPKIPESIKAEEDVSEIEEIDISELAERLKEETKMSAESEEISSESLAAEDDTFIEGRWEGNVEKEEREPETSSEDEFKELLTTLKDLSEEEETIISGDEQEQETSDDYSRGDVTHKVVTSDSLSSLSLEYYGDASKWREIYKANKDKISNPDTLRVGLVLLIPDITSLERTDEEYETEATVEELTGGTTHTVRAGDSLYKLAKKYYNDPAKWEKIYNANEDTLENKNSLKIGQKLIIPE